MEEVQEAEYLHIHRANDLSHLWDVGAKFFFNGTRNNFSSYFENTIFGITMGSEFIDVLEFLQHVISAHERTTERLEIIEANNGYNLLEALKKARSLINEYNIQIRESFFEEVRRVNFTNHPSRQNCIWVIENNFNSLEYWKLLLNYNPERDKILKLKLTGKIHKASQSYLHLNVINGRAWRERAFKYWSGANETGKDDYELIFEGFVEVVGIVWLKI